MQATEKKKKKKDNISRTLRAKTKGLMLLSEIQKERRGSGTEKKFEKTMSEASEIGKMT